MVYHNEDILKFPLFLLKLTGQYPHTPKFIFITSTLVTSSCLALIVGLSFYHLYLTYKDPYVFLEGIGYSGVYIHGFFKVTIGAIKQKELANLIKQHQHFWDITKTPSALKEKFQFVIFVIRKIQKAIFCVYVMAAFTINLTAYLNKQLPCGLWLIEGHDIYYKFQFIIQACTLGHAAVNHVGALDLIFMSTCVTLVLQFMLLGHKLKMLHVSEDATVEDTTDFLKALVSYIKYHDLLLRFVKDLERTYSSMMLVEYTTLVTILCASMLIVLESNDYGKVASEIFLTACAFLQLLVYCLLMDYMNEQAYKISFAIYTCDWYVKHIPGARNLILLIILRSQRQVKFTAGGLYEINSETLLKIVKMAWSVCVATRSMKKIEK